jgi:hypothetical protein
MYCIDSYSRISREDHQIDALSGKLGLKNAHHFRTGASIIALECPRPRLFGTDLRKVP